MTIEEAHKVLESHKHDIATLDDVVNHPSHYTDGKIEVLDFIEDKKLGFHLGNVVKYVARAGKKDPAKTIEDLEKAEFYLKRKIDKLKEASNEHNNVIFDGLSDVHGS